MDPAWGSRWRVGGGYFPGRYHRRADMSFVSPSKRVCRVRCTASRVVAATALATLVLSLTAAAAATVGPLWSDEEQQFVYELNRVRWNPALAGFAPGALRPAPPLAINSALAAAAASRADEMAEFDYFAHQSPITGLWPNEVARAFGYPLPADWPGESNNIESLYQGLPAPNSVLQSLLRSPDHRCQLLGEGWYATYREIGAGANLGERIWSILTAYDDSGRTFLTGVAYRDANRNARMDLGEGRGGVTVTAGSYRTVTNSAGGWALSVPPGQYSVTASDGPFVGVSAITVRIGSYNIEIDFRSGRPRPLALAYETCGSRSPTILGTSGADVLLGTEGDDVIHGLGGNDAIVGGGGNDLICGGTGDDILTGGPGADRLLGGPGTDRCSAGDSTLTCETN